MTLYEELDHQYQMTYQDYSKMVRSGDYTAAQLEEAQEDLQQLRDALKQAKAAELVDDLPPPAA
jgi:hypothetical protein